MFSLFPYHLFLKKDVALHLNKRKPPIMPLSKCLVDVACLMECSLRIFLSRQRFLLLYFTTISSGKGKWHSTWVNLKSLSKNVLCQVWLKLATWFWRRRWKCEKLSTTTLPTTTTTKHSKQKSSLTRTENSEKINKSVMTFKTRLLQNDMINFDQLWQNASF